MRHKSKAHALPCRLVIWNGPHLGLVPLEDVKARACRWSSSQKHLASRVKKRLKTLEMQKKARTSPFVLFSTGKNTCFCHSCWLRMTMKLGPKTTSYSIDFVWRKKIWESRDVITHHSWLRKWKSCVVSLPSSSLSSVKFIMGDGGHLALSQCSFGVKNVWISKNLP